MTMSNTQSARISASAAGASGKAENTRAAALAGRRNRIALPCASLQAGCEAVRVHGQVEPRRRGGEPGGVEAGRPAGERRATAEAGSPRAPSSSPTAKRRSRSAPSSALRRRILAEAAALCSARRERSAPAAGGSARRKASRTRARRRRRTADRPPLPFRSPAPRPGSAPAAERLAVPGFCRAPARLARAVAAAQERASRGRRRVGEEVEIGANRLAHDESFAAVCHVIWQGIRPACRGLAMSDKIALSDIIRRPKPANAAKPALSLGPRRSEDNSPERETPALRAPCASRLPEDAGRAPLRSAAEASESAAPPLPCPGPATRAQRPAGQLGGDRQGLRPLGASRQHPARLRRRLENVRLLAAPPGPSETPPDPEAVGLYLAAQVERGGAELSVATLERRLSGIAWRYRQLGQPLDIRDRHIATVLAGIRRRHARPPLQKAAIFADELLAMLATLDMDLSGLRDRAILAIGFAGGLRRPKSLGSIAGRTKPRTAPAGSKSSPRAPCSPSAARPGGARSRSAGARDRRPARSPCSRPGCGSGGSPAGPCSGPSRARTAASDRSG